MKIKAYLASLAGAFAVIIYNDGSTPDRLTTIRGTLNQPFHLPVISINHHLGFYFLFMILILPKIKKSHTLKSGLEFLHKKVYLNLLVNVSHSDVETWNIHAQSRYGLIQRRLIFVLNSPKQLNRFWVD